MAIARTWRAWATREGAESYEQHFTGALLTELRTISGFRKANLLRRKTGDHVEIRVITVWDSMAAIMRFAGTTPDDAVVEPEAQRVLLQYDRTVEHYELQEFES